jgi:amidophosphoribosyltransferase
MDVDEIRSYLNVDTLSYLTHDRLVDAVGAPGAGFCTACLTGEYPVAIPPELGKGVLEIDDVLTVEGVTAAPALLLAAEERTLPSQGARAEQSGESSGG